jgi:glycosyltransferase involved in cell wall biosynthesis
MRIGIDLLPLASQRTGVGVYVTNLLQSLLNESEHTFTYANYCTSHRETQRRKKIIEQRIADQHLGRVICRSRWFPGWEAVRRYWPIAMSYGAIDLFHFTSPACTLAKPRVPYAVTVCDLAWYRVPELYDLPASQPLLRRLPSLLKSASAVFAISNATAADVQEFCEVPAEKIFLTPLAVRPEFEQTPDEEQRNIAQAERRQGAPYYLCLGTTEPRKNYLRLLRAYVLARQRGLDRRLVFVGGAGSDHTEMLEVCRAEGLNDFVSFQGYVDDSATRRWLWGADALLMPSLYEGFGLPVLEAMIAGTRVLVASAGSLPEVVGEHARIVQPREIESIAQGLLELAGDMQDPARWRAAAINWAKSFSWQDTARQTLRGYQFCREH